MAKKKISKVDLKKLKEDNHNRQLKDLRERLNFIPEPTYIYDIGTEVTVGNLQDVAIYNVLENGKIYEIDYTNVDNNYGKPIRHEHCKMYVGWTEARKLQDGNKVSLIKNEDIRLNYSQKDLRDLFSKVYFFGINFEPEYQRDYVWNLEDQVSLIDSIFNNVDIGKLAFIHYDTKKWMETGFGYEILDGKQRIRAILDYYEDRFQYKGKYFSDLSYRDRNHFINYNISVAEVRNLNREQILRYFIKLNTGGKIMSKEQVDKVRKLLEQEVK